MTQREEEEEQLVLFVDSEGEPVQELAAICVDIMNHRIKDVYLKWAKIPAAFIDVDWFSRRHIHGLNRVFLRQHGFENEEALVADFQTWRQQFTINEIFAHAPAKEEILLSCSITDVKLPPWADRYKSHHHRLALSMKTLNLPVKDTICKRFETHDEYEGWKEIRTKGDLARQEYSHHCALYDCLSILMFKFPNTRLFSS